MKIRVRMTKYVLAGLALLGSLPASAASFNCAAARSPVERLICATPELSDMDDDMDYLYRHVVISAGDRQERTAQRLWIRRRNACAADVDCLRSAYIDRVSELLELPSLKLPERGLGTDETKVFLKSGWVIDDDGQPPVAKPCAEVREFVNRKAAYWWRFKQGALYSAYCSPAAADAPVFDLPPWKDLEPVEYKSLIAQLLKFKKEGSRRYFEGMRKHDGADYGKQADEFIGNGGTLKLWSAHIFDRVRSADATRNIVTAGQEQTIVQLGFPNRPDALRRFTSPECKFPVETTQLFLVTKDLSGPAPFFASELESAALRLYRKRPVLVTANDASLSLIFPLGGDPDTECNIKFIAKLKSRH
jgi:uncharacterized protein